MIAAFDLGEYLGIGLDTNQIWHLAGALFLGLFGLSALRHGKRAEGAMPIVWIAVAVGLFAGCLVVVARGFPDVIPDWARPWIETNRLVRAGATLALLGTALVLISGHWVRGSITRWVCRVMGLALAGVAVWLAAGWFSAEVPDEVRKWAVDSVIARVVVVLSLVCLAAAFWFRQSYGTAHARWFNRAFAPPAIAGAVFLAWRWFGSLVEFEIDPKEFQLYVVAFGVIASGVCLFIAAGAYLIRERPPRTKPVEPFPMKQTAKPVTRQLPVATLLDEKGRPVLPGPARGQAGPAGA